jgi:alpha-tubulin suppressor-like RCC1 family protein
VSTENPLPTNTIYSWGYNNVGQLATINTTLRSSPVSVLGGFTDWCQVSAGVTTTIAIRTNGTAWAWGEGINGTLGDNSTVNKSSPVSVVGGFTDWCQVSAGGNRANNARSAVAVRQNGTAWAWGYNGEGALGDNTTTNKSSPVSVIGGFCDWCQVVTRSGGAAGIRTNGTLWSWGTGSNGELGNNCTANRSSPVSVVGGFTDWCQVAGTISQFSQILAVRTNGSAWAWGSNTSGQLGDNTTVNKSSPVSVIGGFTDWCQLAGGDKLSLGVRQNGTLWAWGYNRVGELGNNTCNVCRSSPVSVVGGFTDWCQASGGEGFATAIRQNGTAWAWGSGNYGRLGDNTANINRSSPVSVAGGFTDWCQISAGRRSAAGLRSSEPYIIN